MVGLVGELMHCIDGSQSLLKVFQSFLEPSQAKVWRHANTKSQPRHQKANLLKLVTGWWVWWTGDAVAALSPSFQPSASFQAHHHLQLPLLHTLVLKIPLL